VLHGRPPVPNKREGKKPQAAGQVFYLGENQGEDPNPVVRSTLLLGKTYAHVLFDSSASPSL